MIAAIRKSLAVVFWLIFPIVPVLLENAYFGLCSLQPFDRDDRPHPDPYDWDQLTWAMMLGPLLGYGFLVGATWKIADEPTRSRWRSCLSRRSTSVAIGPWFGFISATAIFATLMWAQKQLRNILPEPSTPSPPAGPPSETWRWISEALFLGVLGWIALAWMIVAIAALRRARRGGHLRAAAVRGFLVAVGFVGTLFGTYWLVTAWSRDYYFDPKIVP